MDKLISTVHRLTSLGTETLTNRIVPQQPGNIPVFYKDVDALGEVALPPFLAGELKSAKGVEAIQASLPQNSQILSKAFGNNNKVGIFEDKALLLEEFTALLYLSNGINRFKTWSGIEHHFRCAPSAGALYPVMVYAAVLNVEGINPGIYYYHEKKHSLLLLKKGDFSENLCMFFEGDSRFKRAGAVFLYSAIFERSERKYTKRGYRYSFLDAGHIAANTATVATAMGLGYVLKSLFLDDRLNTFVGIDGTDEAVLAGAAVGKNSDSTTVHKNIPVREIIAKLERLSVWKKSKNMPDGTELYHQETARTIKELSDEKFSALPEKKYSDPAVETLTTNYGRLNKSVFKTIIERRSIRKYSSEPLSSQELSTLLFHSLGEGADGNRRCIAVDSLYPFESYVLVQNVEDIQQGIYRYLPGLHGLELLEAGDKTAELTDALLGRKFPSQAALVVIFTVRLDNIPPQIGARIYRSAMIAVGLASQNITLAAEAMDFGACQIGAFYDKDVNSLIGVDGNSEVSLLLVTVGRK